jgi:predicted esterase
MMPRPPLDPVSARARSVAAVLAALLLAACGGGDEASTAATAATPSEVVLGTVQTAPDPAWLRSSATVAVLPKAAVDASGQQRGWAALSGPARCDVTLHAIVHPTVGPSGEPTDASGTVLVPSGSDCPGPFPLLSYSRGTDRDRTRTLATVDDRETQAIVGFFAARGYVVVASDYLGYAQSTFPYHPYLHAESVARTNLDALRASRTLLARLGVADSGKLFLTGYSQGGHAALATQRAIERDRPAGFEVTATGAMSGPYDLVGTVEDLSAFVPLLLADLGDGSLAQAVELRIGNLIGTSAAELLRERERLREVLRANGVIGWRPAAPVLLCGGARDPIVPFANSRRAAEDFAARGATVSLVDVEAEAVYRPLLPPAGALITDLGSYHQGAVPPPCFQVVRDRLLERLR